MGKVLVILGVGQKVGGCSGHEDQRFFIFFKSWRSFEEEETFESGLGGKKKGKLFRIYLRLKLLNLSGSMDTQIGQFSLDFPG